MAARGTLEQLLFDPQMELHSSLHILRLLILVALPHPKGMVK